MAEASPRYVPPAFGAIGREGSASMKKNLMTKEEIEEVRRLWGLPELTDEEVLGLVERAGINCTKKPTTKEEFEEIRRLWMIPDGLTDAYVLELVERANISHIRRRKPMTKEELDKARRSFGLSSSVPDDEVRWHVDMERMYGDGWPADRYTFTPEELDRLGKLIDPLRDKK
jgi:hypothetical protein